MKSLLTVVGVLALQVPVTTPQPSLAAKTTIARVTSLLRDMQKGAQAEMDKDEALKEKMDCWCTTNNKEKTQAVKDAQELASKLNADINAHAAMIAKTKTEIEQLKKEIVKSQESLEQATAVREKQNAEFVAQNEELVAAIAQLDGALGSLEKFNTQPKAALLQLHAVARNFHHYNKELQSDLLDILSSFPADNLRGKVSLSQQPIFQSYASRSGEIFGILQTLKENMEKDAGSAMAEEKRQAKAFAQLKAVRLDEIATAKAAIVDKEADKADSQIKKSNAMQDLEDTKAALSADERFLMDLEDKCSNWESDFAERTKTRQEEIKAVNAALKILNDDDVRDLISRTQALTLVQTNVSSRRTRAVALLQSNGLLALAATAQLDAFKKVHEALDAMTTKLKAQQGEEFSKRDACAKNLEDNEDDRGDTKDNIEDLNKKIDSLTDNIATTTEEIEGLQSDVSTLRTAMKAAGEDRKAQNVLFQQTVKDSRATIHILDMVLRKLQAFYAPDALKATQEQQAQPALLQQPADFESYQSQGQSSGVMQLIMNIQRDAKVSENQAVKGEQDAQSGYASFISDSNNSIRRDQTSITNKKDVVAKSDSSKAQANADLESADTSLVDLRKTNADLHTECDFLLKNFDLRQQARQQELDAIASAKAILSGADFK